MKVWKGLGHGRTQVLEDLECQPAQGFVAPSSKDWGRRVDVGAQQRSGSWGVACSSYCTLEDPLWAVWRMAGGHVGRGPC